MPLIEGYSDKTRSKNIARLMHEGYPRKRAIRVGYEIQRRNLRRAGLSTRRVARRNPISRHRIKHQGIGWWWLGGGAAMGASGALLFDSFQPTHPNGKAMAFDALAYGGAAMALGGILGGFERRSWATAILGLVAGGIAYGVGVTGAIGLGSGWTSATTG